MNHNSTFTINTQKIKENINNILKHLNHKTKMIPVLKADAYGHGLPQIAKLFEDTKEIEHLAVAQVSEALTLINQNTTKKIMLLCGITDDQIDTVIKHNIEPLIHDLASFHALDQKLKEKNIKHYPVHLKINTGLNRLGFWPDEDLDALIPLLKETDSFNIISTYSHFIEGAKKDSEISHLQNKRFQKALKKLNEHNIPTGFHHLCDSGAYEWYEDAYYDAVRIGRALYMDNPNLDEKERFKDIGSWHAKVISKRSLKKGDTLGYGGSFTCNQDMEIAVINIGYGDGLLMDLVSLKAPLLINNDQTRLLSIAMDQSTIDITGLDVKLYDIVTLFGFSPEDTYLSSHEIAKLLDDEGVTLTTLISKRVHRIYE